MVAHLFLGSLGCTNTVLTDVSSRMTGHCKHWRHWKESKVRCLLRSCYAYYAIIGREMI